MRTLQTIATLAVVLLGLSGTAQENRATTLKLPLDPSTNCQIRYYYYPNLEAYYDKLNDLYIFRDQGEWKREKEIPSGYRGYGLYNKANVAITDFDGDDPIPFFDHIKKLYPYNSLKRNRAQTASN